MAITNGKTYTIQCRGNNAYVNLYGTHSGTSISNGNEVNLYATATGSDQKWIIESFNGGQALTSSRNSNYALNIKTSTGICQVWNKTTCTVNDSKLDFPTVSASTNVYNIRLMSHDLYLTRSGTTNDLYWSVKNGVAASQQFTFIEDAPPALPLMPHGTYTRYECTQLSADTDGAGDEFIGTAHHNTHTSYMDGVLNASLHRYIVIPCNYSNSNATYAQTLGCVGVLVDNATGMYKFGVVGDGGPDTDAGKDPNYLREVSVKMIRDLGYTSNGTTAPAGNFSFIIFHGTKKSSYPSATLNADVEALGRQYFY